MFVVGQLYQHPKKNIVQRDSLTNFKKCIICLLKTLDYKSYKMLIQVNYKTMDKVYFH